MVFLLTLKKPIVIALNVFLRLAIGNDWKSKKKAKSMGKVWRFFCGLQKNTTRPFT